MQRAGFIFALAVLSFLTFAPTAEAETCSQAAAACNSNCQRGHAAGDTKKDWCTADCAGRRTECLSTGRWRQTNRGYSDREGLIKK